MPMPHDFHYKKDQASSPKSDNQHSTDRRDFKCNKEMKDAFTDSHSLSPYQRHQQTEAPLP